MTGPEASPARVFVVEDHALVRNVLVRLIKRSADLALAGTAASAEAALEQLPAAAADIVLVDISLPGKDGLDLISRLHELYPALLLLVVSGHSESVYAPRAIHAGARGFLAKDSLVKLPEAIGTVRAGGVYVSEAVQVLLRAENRGAAGAGAPGAGAPGAGTPGAQAPG